MSPAAGQWAEADAWRITRLVEIGADESLGLDYLFADIGSLRLDSLGRIYVLDRSAKSVRVFDQAGLLVRVIGGQGGGPGEFNNPIGLAWDKSGQLMVADPGNARFTVFDTAGVLVSTHPRSNITWDWPWQGGFDRTGAFYEETLQPVGDDYVRVYVRHSPAPHLTPVDTVPLPPYQREFYRLRIGGGGIVLAVPFSPVLRWAYDGVGGTWSAINDTHRFTRRSPQGDTTHILEKPTRRLPVTEAEVDEAFASVKLEASVRSQIDESRIPEMKPAFTSFALDERGNLWAFSTDGSGSGSRVNATEADVFSPGSGYLGRVELGVATSPPPYFRNGLMVAARRDDFDRLLVSVSRVDRDR